jgi:hypothetical protein
MPLAIAQPKIVIVFVVFPRIVFSLFCFWFLFLGRLTLPTLYQRFSKAQVLIFMTSVKFWQEKWGHKSAPRES